MFLPLEYRAAGEKDPVAIRYSLGWTVVGPVSGKKSRLSESSYFTRVFNNADKRLIGNREYETEIQAKCIPPKLGEAREFLTQDNGDYNVIDNIPFEEHLIKEQTDASESTLSKEVEQERMNEDLKHQLERLWKTDFEGSLVETKVCPSLEDKKVLQIMEEMLKVVDGHFQVVLPWRNNPPYLPNNKVVAERQGFLLKKRLLRYDDLLRKYQTTMNDYMEKRYTEKVPREQLEVNDRLIWYLPHHPVTHPLKPNKVRVVYDCADSNSYKDQIKQIN